MSDTTKMLAASPDSDLALLVKEAAREGEPIRLEVGDSVYTLWVRRVEDVDELEDLWAGYDPEKVREALRRTAGILAGVDKNELMADLMIQREQDSSGRPA